MGAGLIKDAYNRGRGTINAFIGGASLLALSTTLYSSPGMAIKETIASGLLGLGTAYAGARLAFNRENHGVVELLRR